MKRLKNLLFFNLPPGLNAFQGGQLVGCDWIRAGKFDRPSVPGSASTGELFFGIGIIKDNVAVSGFIGFGDEAGQAFPVEEGL